MTDVQEYRSHVLLAIQGHEPVKKIAQKTSTEPF